MDTWEPEKAPVAVFPPEDRENLVHILAVRTLLSSVCVFRHRTVCGSLSEDCSQCAVDSVSASLGVVVAAVTASRGKSKRNIPRSSATLQWASRLWRPRSSAAETAWTTLVPRSIKKGDIKSSLTMVL